MRSAIGLYFHVPFCDGKCPYCDFYSVSGGEALMDRYVSAMKESMTCWAAEHGKGKIPVKTVYFGGGTPSLLGAERLAALLSQVKQSFDLAAAPEITLEENPSHLDGPAGSDFFSAVRQAGFNRLSMGMQSANTEELAMLGRKHSPEDVRAAVEAARAAGFDNISVDLMLGLPGGNKEKLMASVEFAAGLATEHISAYILKVEPNTPFAARGTVLPEDDDTADQYLFLVEELKKRGYRQYEISNFAKPGKESHHNLVYWHGEEYLGFGPGAHSFYRGKRFFYPRDLRGFIDGNPPIPDGEGGNFEEFAMLNLRLAEGLCKRACREKFGEQGEKAFARVLKNTQKCPPGLVRADNKAVSFTPKGFLLSNTLILTLLDGTV